MVWPPVSTPVYLLVALWRQALHFHTKTTARVEMHMAAESAHVHALVQRQHPGLTS